jgi:glycosyltransferase involved in cell wall biosynthesis
LKSVAGNHGGVSEDAPALLVVTREFPPAVLGGIAYHLGALYRAVVARGASVRVLAGRPPEADRDPSAPRPTGPRVTVEPVPFGGRRGHHLRFPVALARHLRGVDVAAHDAVVVHTPLPFGFDAPTVGKYHDCVRAERAAREPAGPLAAALDALVDPTRRWVERRSLRRVDAAVFVSRLNRRAWGRHYRLPEHSVVHHNGVDADRFTPAPAAGDGAGHLLFVGDSRRKGLDRVLSFAPDAPYPVRLVGPESVDAPNARALGRLDQSALVEQYRGAVATLHPARFEAFGNVVLESLACGTPVVTTPGCGAAELIEPGRGAVVEPTALRAGVERAVRTADPEACRAAATAHDWDRVAERTLALVAATGRAERSRDKT